MANGFAATVVGAGRLQVRLHAAQQRRQDLRRSSQIERKHLSGGRDAQLIALAKALEQLRAVGERHFDLVGTDRDRAPSDRRIWSTVKAMS